MDGIYSIAEGYDATVGEYTNSIALGTGATVGTENVISFGDGDGA